MNTNHQRDSSGLIESYSRWSVPDECDLVVVNKAFEKFSAITGDPKLAAVLVMAWATLQTKRGT